MLGYSPWLWFGILVAFFVITGLLTWISGLIGYGLRVIFGRVCPECGVKAMQEHKKGCPVAEWDGGTWA